MDNIRNKVLFLTGGTGFIGTQLSQFWLARSDRHKVIIQTRYSEKNRSNEKIEYVSSYSCVKEPVIAVVNLAGEPIADKRWSVSRKRELEKSRIDLTCDLIQQIQCRDGHPSVFISASAIGFYGLSDDDKNENHNAGQGYAADLCDRWETEASKSSSFARVAIMRLGVVLGNGGVLKKLLPLYRLGLGGTIASGQQWFSWIHMNDVVSTILRVIDHDSMSGIYNLCSPNPVHQKDFANTLGKVLKRPTFLPTPGFVLSLGFGEMAKELLIGGQKVLPSRLLSSGYSFQYDELAPALEAVVGAE